jgi:hypothetical protein
MSCWEKCEKGKGKKKGNVIEKRGEIFVREKGRKGKEKGERGKKTRK